LLSEQLAKLLPKTPQQIESSQAYYTNNKESRCAYRRARYALVEPKCEVQEQYVKEILGHLLIKSEAKVQDLRDNKKTKMPMVMCKAVCRVAAKRLLNKSLETRREYVGSLLKACRLIKSLKIDRKEDFGEGCHTASTEPYYYDTATSLSRETTLYPLTRMGSVE